MTEVLASRETNKKVTSNPEADIIERQKQDVNILTTQLAVSLGTKFDLKGLPFDINTFKTKLTHAISQVFLNPDIPEIAKEKFKQDLLWKLDLLAQVTVEDIKTLQTRRNVESLSVEFWEQQWKTESQKQAYYLDKILTETIGKYIEPVSLGLIEAFSREKTIQNNREVHHKASFEKFQTNMKKLDAIYGFDFASKIPEMSKWWMNVRKEFEELMKQWVFRESLFLQQMIRNGVVNENTKRVIGKQAEVTRNGKTINLIDVYLMYRSVIWGYNERASEFNGTRQIALADDVFARMKGGLGMDQLKSEFDHLTTKNIEEKMKKANFADMVIMATQLAQIAPIIWDIAWGSLDIGSAITGMSNDGAKLSAVERTFSGIFGTLGITVFGWFLYRARKAGKMAEIIWSVWLLKKSMPEKLDDFIKNWGKIPDKVKDLLQVIFPPKKDVPSTKAWSSPAKNEKVTPAINTPIREVKWVSEWEKTELTSKIREIQIRTWLRVPKDSILKACEELRELKPHINILEKPEDLETLVKLLDLRPDFSFKRMPLGAYNYEVFPFNLQSPLNQDEFDRGTLDLLRVMDNESFIKLVRTWLLSSIWIYGEKLGWEWIRKILQIASKIPEWQILHIKAFLRNNASIQERIEWLENLLGKGIDLSWFSHLYLRHIDPNSVNKSQKFKESWVFEDFLKWIRENPELDKGKIEQMIQDISNGNTVNLPSPWQKWNIPRRKASERIYLQPKWLTEGERMELTSKIQEIQSRLDLNIPNEGINHACGELRELKPHINILEKPEDLETLVKLLDLRPDFSFKKMPLEASANEVFPFVLRYTLNHLNLDHSTLDLVRGIDGVGFSKLVRSWILLIIGIFEKTLWWDWVRKIMQVASRIPEWQLVHVDAFLGNNASIQELIEWLERLLGKGVDLSWFTQLDDRLKKSPNESAFEDFRKSKAFEDFLKWIRENPGIEKGEIEKQILRLSDELPDPEFPLWKTQLPEWMNRYSWLLQKEEFSPEKWIEYIRRLPSSMRKEALKVWKERYREQMTILSELPSRIRRELFESGWTTVGTPDQILEKLIDSLWSWLQKLSIAQRKEVLTRSRKYIEKATTVRKYADEYKDNPKDLVSKCLNTDISKLKWEVTMEVNGANFTFYIHNEDDYKLLANKWDITKSKEESSGGVSLGYSIIEELKGTITLQNGKKIGNNSTQIHETAHVDNTYKMPDKFNGDPLSRAKDEIIAYLTDGTNIRDIAKTLLEKSKDGWIYDYYKESNPDNYENIRPLYESELSKLLRIADKFHQNRERFPFYLDLLAVTPARDWHRIEDFFLS